MASHHHPPESGFGLHLEPSIGDGEHIVRILSRVVAQRTALITTQTSAQDAQLILAIEPGIGAEGYAIQSSGPSAVRIVGNDALGLLYGVGKFLRLSGYQPGRVNPTELRGQSVPHAAVRGMYCAFNFKNWYVSAPREELGRYFEELGLWGLNTIFISMLMVDPANPDALGARVRDNRQVLSLIKRAGLKTGLLFTPNLVNHEPPAGSRAVDVRDTTPARRGNVDIRVCPSNPAGRRFLQDTFETFLAGYEDIGVDFVAAFPYDAGGCGCAQCSPWGSRGFVTTTKDLFSAARRRYPTCQRVLTTWCFDVLPEPEHEYEELHSLLKADRSWVDYIMADGHEDFPRYPLDHGVPGGLPMLNFPEISMWGRYPWGGYGANPLPARYQRLWDQIKHLCQGGFPYSEGIFEDINKVFCAGFYWNREARAADILREYVAYEYSPRVVDAVVEAVGLLESNWPRETSNLERSARAWTLLQDADSQLPDHARRSWRWRILYLRGLIDFELTSHPGQPHSDRCDEAFEELTRIYHAENADSPDAPMTRRRRARLAQKIESMPAGSE